jgi:hypothetical protein
MLVRGMGGRSAGVGWGEAAPAPRREAGRRGYLTGELARQIVEAGIRHYCVTRRERIAHFVDQYFSLRGAVALHRAALGWDIVRAPINLVMAAPAAGLRVVAAGARRLGAVHVASALGRQRLLVRTSVARRVEWLVYTELLELPCQVDDCVATRDALAETILADPRVLGTLRDMLTSIDPKGDDPLLRPRIQRALEEYTGARAAAAEITTALPEPRHGCGDARQADAGRCIVWADAGVDGGTAGGGIVVSIGRGARLDLVWAVS